MTSKAPSAPTTSEPAATAVTSVPEDVTWDEFDLSDHILEGIEAAGWTEPMPVQVAAIPPILEGREVVVQARTGTGKTGAFGLPLLELLDPYRKDVQAVVLTPTRELARQVAGDIEKLGQFGEITAVAIYGGDPMSRQIAALRKGAQIVVGTPGRVLDHLDRRTLRVSGVDYLVLDEADEMLSMGFEKEMRAILRQLPRSYRTLLFSATFPPGIGRIFAKHQRQPVEIRLSSDAVVGSTTEHHYYLAPRQEKDHYLVAVLDEERVQSGIVFCNRRDETRMVANMLRRHGFIAQAINSDMAQSERDEVMGKLRSGELTVLVATDLAARGIDVSQLSHVINYTVPESPEMYVHRTGRTGRVGRAGVAVTLVGGQELTSLKLIEKLKGIRMQERKLPSEDVIMERRVERLIDDLKRVAQVRSPEQALKGDRPEFHAVAKRVQTDPECQEVVYMLLQSFFEGVRRTAARELSDETTGFVSEGAPADDPAPAAASRRTSGGRSAPPRRRSSRRR